MQLGAKLRLGRELSWVALRLCFPWGLDSAPPCAGQRPERSSMPLRGIVLHSWGTTTLQGTKCHHSSPVRSLIFKPSCHCHPPYLANIFIKGFFGRGENKRSDGKYFSTQSLCGNHLSNLVMWKLFSLLNAQYNRAHSARFLTLSHSHNQ